MNSYFWVGRNSTGLYKSGVVSAANPHAAYEYAVKMATTWSNDKYVIVRLERVE